MSLDKYSEMLSLHIITSSWKKVLSLFQLQVSPMGGTSVKWWSTWNIGGAIILRASGMSNQMHNLNGIGDDVTFYNWMRMQSSVPESEALPFAEK